MKKKNHICKIEFVGRLIVGKISIDQQEPKTWYYMLGVLGLP
jgi:hypothetical protein